MTTDEKGAFRGAFFAAGEFSRLLFFPFEFLHPESYFILFFKKDKNTVFSKEPRGFSRINHAHLAAGEKAIHKILRPDLIKHAFKK